jgi:DNA polymerase-1
MWEKGVKVWRIAESKRRRREISALIKAMVAEYKADPKLVAEAHQWANKEIEKLDLSGLAPGSAGRKKTTLITKAHSNRAKEALKNHYWNNNKLDQISYDLVPIEDMAPYACADVHYTWLLHLKFFNDLTKDSSLVQLYINEMHLCRMLFNMEQGGVKINRAYLEKIGPELYQEAHDAEQEVYKQVGYEFNIGSPKQLVEAIQSVGIKLTKYTKTSQEKLARGEITESECTFAADAQVLEFLAAEHSFAKAVLDYRGALKIKSTYIEGILNKLDEWDFIHSSFRQNVSTGRMSSSAPNLTNIPARDRRVKVAFEVPDDDHVFVFIDYSQIEVRIVAHYSQDPLLLSCYPFEGEGRDIHSLTAAEVILGVDYDTFLDMLHEKSDHKADPHCTCNPCVATAARRIGKTVNFLIIYGGGGAVLQSQVSTPDKYVSVETCKGYINKYMRKYRGVKQWVKLTDNEVLERLKVQNLFGRYRRFPDINHVDDKGKYRRLRQAANFLVQGTAADLFKYALVRVSKFIEGTGIRIVNVVHDDIQFYFPKNKLHLLKDVVNIMEDFQLTVPIIADVDISTTTWAAKVPVDRSMLEDFSYEKMEELLAA